LALPAAVLAASVPFFSKGELLKVKYGTPTRCNNNKHRLITLDIKDLYVNIPLKETTDITRTQLLKNNNTNYQPDHKLTRNHPKIKLPCLSTTNIPSR
jgi:hypothetical protein